MSPLPDCFSTFFFSSSSRIRSGPAVDRPARGHHCHLHLPGAGRARAPAHLAQERAGAGARRARQAQKQQQVSAGAAPPLLAPALSHRKSPRQGEGVVKGHSLMDPICKYLRRNCEIPRLRGFTPGCALTSCNITLGLKVPTEPGLSSDGHQPPGPKR